MAKPTDQDMTAIEETACSTHRSQEYVAHPKGPHRDAQGVSGGRGREDRAGAFSAVSAGRKWVSQDKQA